MLWIQCSSEGYGHTILVTIDIPKFFPLALPVSRQRGVLGSIDAGALRHYPPGMAKIGPS